MRASLTVLTVAAALAATAALPAQARVGEPDAYEMGQALCRNLSDEYAGSYIIQSSAPKAETAQLFEDVKAVQDEQTAEAARRGAGAMETFQASVAHFVQRTALIMAMEKPDLGPLAAREELYNQCNARLEPLRGLPEA
jgi:hypothetical protein